MLGTLTLAVAACGSSGGGGTSSSAPGDTPLANAANGGTLNLGIWQEPTSFLAAGITDSLTFSYLEDAPIQEGLLWYKSTDETQSAKSIADYFKPWLATEVPTVANGDVKTSGCAGVKKNPLLNYSALGTAGSSAYTSGTAGTVTPAMCVTWKLRDGVVWHDGSKFSSHDVCDTYQFFYLKYGDKNPTALLSTTGWDQAIDCTEKDPLTAVVSFKTKYGPYLALSSGVYGVLPSSILDKAFAAGAETPDHAAGNVEMYKSTVDLSVGSKNPLAFKGSQTLDLMMDGTGPYVFQSVEAGKALTMVQNKNYWNKAHKPHLDSLVFKVQSDLSAEVNAAKAKDIDMGFDFRLYNLKTLLDVAKTGALAVQTIPDSGAEKLDMNVCANARGLCGATAKQSPFTADKNVRRAILTGIDRQDIINSQAAGKTIIPQDAWQYLGIEYIKDPTTNPQTKYDPAAAQKLLEDNGYKLSPACDGGQTRANAAGKCLNLDLGTTSNNPSRVATESLIAGYLQKIGIHVNTPFTPNLKPGKFFGSFADGGPLYTHNFDMAQYTNTASSPAEPDSYYSGYHADCGGTCPSDNQIPSAANKGNGQNATGEANTALDKEFDLGRSSVDLTERTKHYKKVEALLAQDLPEVPLYQQVTVNSYTTKLQQFKPNDLVWDWNSYDWYCTGGKCQ
ncbi:MAG: peptide ABC transporter substrate-binding protein [Candidatus Dormibacteria bacterium]